MKLTGKVIVFVAKHCPGILMLGTRGGGYQPSRGIGPIVPPKPPRDWQTSGIGKTHASRQTPTPPDR